MSEALARRFHEAYERLAPSFGYETRAETREFDPASPNGKLMIAVCGEVFGLVLRLLGAAVREADGWLDEARGCAPTDLIGGDPLAEARALVRCPDCEFFGGSHDVECPRRA